MVMFVFHHNPLSHNDPFILISVWALGACDSTVLYVLIIGTNLCLWTKIRGDKIISLCLHQFFIMQSVLYWPKWISMDLRWKQSCITGSDSKLWKQKIPQGKCIYSLSSPNLLFPLCSNCDQWLYAYVVIWRVCALGASSRRPWMCTSYLFLPPSCLTVPELSVKAFLLFFSSTLMCNALIFCINAEEASSPVKPCSVADVKCGDLYL